MKSGILLPPSNQHQQQYNIIQHLSIRIITTTMNKTEEPELIGHGAEAKCWKVYEQNNQRYVVIKQRLRKKYRHPKLDMRINTFRVKSQARILEKVLKCGIAVPTVYKMNSEQITITMQYIPGPKLKNYLNNSPNQASKILTQLANIIHKLHAQGITHGDLTTSNMIIKQQQIYLLDFGLGSLAASIQDKAVDLYLFERAFIATHPQLSELFTIFLQQYTDKSVINRLEQVRKRGRKKIAFG